jgi:hypothetical protein
MNGVFRSLPILLASFLAAVAAGHAHAQRFAGLVVDATSDRAIASARVRLLGPAGAIVQSLTDATGAFQLTAPRPGSYHVQVDALGYRQLITDTVSIGHNQVVSLRLRMGIAAIPLAALTVVSRGRDALHESTYDGLYARRAIAPAVGSDRVFVKSDREFASAIRPSDLLNHVKPRALEWDRTRGTNAPCLPIVFWHGFLLARRVLAEDRLHGSVDDLEGLEVYRDYSSLPLGYRMDLDSKRPDYLTGPLLTHIRQCGVVAMWPRRPDYPRRQE